VLGPLEHFAMIHHGATPREQVEEGGRWKLRKGREPICAERIFLLRVSPGAGRDLEAAHVPKREDAVRRKSTAT